MPVATDRKNMTTKNAGTTTPQTRQSPTNPIMNVMSDQAISETVIIHLRENRSPTGPAMNAIPASVQLRTELIQPICTSLRPRSRWIGIVKSPKSALSAWWKKNAQLSIATRNHL